MSDAPGDPTDLRRIRRTWIITVLALLPVIVFVVVVVWAVLYSRG